MSAVLGRTPDRPIEDLFLVRRSSHSFTGEPIPEDLLLSFFEAARWAPSSHNWQPWRFVWATAGTPEWDGLFAVINDANKTWAKKASALVAVLSKSTFRPPVGGFQEEVPTHAFDTGAALENLALQAAASGWCAHAIAGFDKPATRRVLSLPIDVHPQVMLAIGRPAPLADLSEAERTRETPRGRRPIDDFVFHGRYPR
jgi:nitroreductase